MRVPEPGPSGTGTIYVERTVGQILATAIRPNGGPALGSQNPAAMASVAAMGIRFCKHHGSDQQRLFIADDVVCEGCSVTRGGPKAELTRFCHGWPERSVTSSDSTIRFAAAVCHSRGPVVSRNWAV